MCKGSKLPSAGPGWPGVIAWRPVSGRMTSSKRRGAWSACTDRPRHRVPVRVDPRGRNDGGRSRSRVVRRAVADQAPGDAAHAVCLSRETMSVAQAGASNRVAAAERPRLIRDVEKAGLQKNGERWLTEAWKQVLAALSAGREATSSELRDELPVLEGSIAYGEEALGRAGSGRSPRVDHAVRRGARRARIEQRRVVQLPAPLGVHEVLARGGADATSGSRGRGETGRAVAARLRPWYGDRHQVVARLDRRGRAQGAGRSPRRRGGSRGTDRIPAARRRRDHRSGRALGGAPAAARPDHDGLVRTGLVPRVVQRAVVRHQR